MPGDFAGAAYSDLCQGWRCAVEMCKGLIKSSGAPGRRPPPHGLIASFLYESKGACVAQRGYKPASRFGFGDCDGVAVGPGDANGGVIWVGIVVGLDGGRHGLFGVDGMLATGVDGAGIQPIGGWVDGGRRGYIGGIWQCFGYGGFRRGVDDDGRWWWRCGGFDGLWLHRWRWCRYGAGAGVDFALYALDGSHVDGFFVVGDAGQVDGSLELMDLFLHLFDAVFIFLRHIRARFVRL